MLKKFNLIILIFSLSYSFLFANESNITISLIREKIELSVKYDVIIKYFTDLAENKIKEKYPNIILKDLLGDITNFELKELLNITAKNGINAFYYIRTSIVDDSILLDIRLYDWRGKLNYSDKFFLKMDKNKKIKITEEKENEWLDIFYKSIQTIIEKSDRKIVERVKTRISYKYDHDFPLIGITISALSAKIYFDERINTKIQRIFSLSPLDLRLSFYPLRYMETGIFCRFDFNNMVYVYYDIDKKTNDYFDTSFLFGYGLFLGVSFFKENLHFSFGGQIYNLYYDISAFPDWNKTNDINSYLLPQFSIYYKLDFKLMKYIYFSVFINFKTLPKFELNNGYFYSRPFLYESFCLEFSFTGVSVMF